MALLQISEPGQSPDPHQRRIAVGIDLGTTHSLVAAVRNGQTVTASDGRTVRAASERHVSTYKTPPTPTVINIGVGGTGQ